MPSYCEIPGTALSRPHTRSNRNTTVPLVNSLIDKERMKTTLLMLSHRASFENKIVEAMKPYELHEPEMDSLFLDFFVDLRNHVNLQNEG